MFGVATPLIFKRALSLVYELEESFTPQYLKDEMDGIAEGVCFTLDQEAKAKAKAETETAQEAKACDVEHWKEAVREMNMLPELIRMAW